jgi:ATP-dependent Clp protease ATP-binding subunit ClpA
MFERFTDRARRVVVLSQEEARMLNHNYIGTEHILLGLIHEGEGVAAQSLEGLGVDRERVRVEIIEIIGRGDTVPAGHIPFTPRAKKVLELSLREALQLGHSYIGTEHILLGLVREGEGVGAQVLQKLGVDLGRVRQQVISQLSSYSDPGPGKRRRLFQRHRPAPALMSMPTVEMGEASPDLGLERFSDDALRAVIAARDEVRRLGQSSLQPEHLVAGLFALHDDPAARRLAAAGATFDGLRRELEAAKEEPSEEEPPHVPPLSLPTLQAITQADALTEGVIDTDVLLDALMATSSAVRLALRAAGADLEALRRDSAA